jgi:hypothetical protein
MNRLQQDGLDLSGPYRPDAKSRPLQTTEPDPGSRRSLPPTPSAGCWTPTDISLLSGTCIHPHCQGLPSIEIP